MSFARTAAVAVTVGLLAAGCGPRDDAAVAHPSQVAGSPSPLSSPVPSALPSALPAASPSVAPSRSAGPRPSTAVVVRASSRPTVCKPKIDLANGPDGYLQLVRVIDDAMWRSTACASKTISVWRVNYHINPDHTGTKEMADRSVLSHAHPTMLFKGDGRYGGICYSYHVVAYVSSIPATVPAAHLDMNKSYAYWRGRGGEMMWQEASTAGCPATNP